MPKAIAKARNATRPRLATPRAIAPRRCSEARSRSSSNISICPPLSVLGALPSGCPTSSRMLRSSSPIGVPFPPEPYAHRRHTPQPHARWEAIRLNLNGSGAPSDLRREHPEPRRITVTGTAGDLHPDSPKRAGKPRIRASPHHHLGHRLKPSICYHAKGPRTQAKPKVKAIVCERKMR